MVISFALGLLRRQVTGTPLSTGTADLNSISEIAPAFLGIAACRGAWNEFAETGRQRILAA